MNVKLLLSCLFGISFVIACQPTTSGTTGTATYTGSCANYTTLTGMLTCIDFYGGTASQVQTACQQSTTTTATFSATACTSTSRIGRCNSANQIPTAYTVINYYSPESVSSAQSDCSSVLVNGVAPTFTAN